MPNDEHPAPVNPDTDWSNPSRTCSEGCDRGHDGRLRPYRPPKRHHGDRRVPELPGLGWEPLDPIEAGSLSWPATRLS